MAVLVSMCFGDAVGAIVVPSVVFGCYKEEGRQEVRLNSFECQHT